MPGGPGVHSEQPEAEGGDVVAFFHPAAKLPQRIVWIPVDDLGLGAEQVKGNELAQVRSSLRDATMDLKVSSLDQDKSSVTHTPQGKVEISGPPPDTLYMEAPTRRMPAVAFI
jgi:hypothetical protein